MRILTITMAALLTFGLGFASTTDLEAKRCKRARTYGYGKGYAKTTARSRARSDWRRKAKRKYGRKWAYWFRASRKQQKCRKSGRKWRCKVRAYACK